MRCLLCAFACYAASIKQWRLEYELCTHVQSTHMRKQSHFRPTASREVEKEQRFLGVSQRTLRVSIVKTYTLDVGDRGFMPLFRFAIAGQGGVETNLLANIVPVVVEPRKHGWLGSLPQGPGYSLPQELQPRLGAHIRVIRCRCCCSVHSRPDNHHACWRGD